MLEWTPALRPAVVTRHGAGPAAPEQYLQYEPAGDPRWTDNPRAATRFDSMREAFSAAVRLPGALRIFTVPPTRF